VKLYFHSPHTSSWRGVSLSKKCVFTAWYLVRHKDNFTLLESRSSALWRCGVSMDLRSFGILPQLHGVTAHKSSTWISTAVKASDQVTLPLVSERTVVMLEALRVDWMLVCCSKCLAIETQWNRGNAMQ